ncbi:hypothetical protein Bca4012_011377 [Brassica carinata]
MNGMMGGSSLAPSPSAFFQHRRRHHGGMMYMTFFWGKNTEVLFDGWPGTSLTMYWVCLASIFVASALSEWISRCGVMKAGPASFGGGLVQTLFYTARVGLSLFDHVGRDVIQWRSLLGCNGWFWIRLSFLDSVVECWFDQLVHAAQLETE